MTKDSIGLEEFGAFLRKNRQKKRIGLRQICREVSFDPSNWSKIERGKLSPPSDEKVLQNWAKALGIKEGTDESHYFIDSALIAQRLIPKTPSEKEMVKLLPAFFRTVRKEKPTKKELDALIELLKESL